MWGEFILNWYNFFAKIGNHSLTAVILTGLVSIIVVKIQKNNKIQELNYANESETKKSIRDISAQIIRLTNDIAVDVNTYVDLVEKYLKNYKVKDIEIKAKEKIDLINLNSKELIEKLVQFELFFTDSYEEHEAVICANALQKKTVEFKKVLEKIQLNYSSNNFKLEPFKKELDDLNKEINDLIPEFSKSVRKSLRLYKYELRGKKRFSERKLPLFINKIKKILKSKLSSKV